MSIELRPVTLPKAQEFVRAHHRHHLPPIGWKWGISAWLQESMVGVVTVGRPVARMLDDGRTLEVTRCCVVADLPRDVNGHTPNVASKLYAAAWRAASALGFTRLITYTLKSEAGTSLKASGWRAMYETADRPKGWDTPSRPREIKAPTEGKTLWEAA